MKALLLVGSPRKGKSTSDKVGEGLLSRLATREVETEKLYVHSAIKSEEKLLSLIEQVAQANIVIIATPLYVDSIPAPVIKLLEILAQELKGRERPSRQLFLAISNCGFPESNHNDIALAIYRQFAQETGFTWAGGLALGAGEPVKNQSLDKPVGIVRNVVAALDMAAEALVQGQPISKETEDLMARPLMPAWMYRQMGNLGWYMQAREHGMLWKLRQKAWEEHQ